MTRTERNQYPAAMLKDRRSRSGLTNQSETQRKNGAGAHNWGSYEQEGELEAAATRDAEQEQDDVFDMEGDLQTNQNANDNENGHEGGYKVGPLGRLPKAADGEALEGQGGNVERDVIATSPSDSMSSIDSVAGGKGGRRMSNVSDEERERARLYRENVKHKGAVDLAHIAKTSYGIAQSPPSGGFMGTSPTQTKNAFAMKQ